MTIDKEIGFVRMDGGEIVRVQNGNKLYQERKKIFNENNERKVGKME